MQKSMDRKLARILADRSCSDFILADAKDADMAYGLSAPGLSPESLAAEGKFKTLDQYRQQIREVIAQGLVDIVLMSAGNSEILTIKERLFEDSQVTPAIRANDTSDIWLAGVEGVYGEKPSRWFRSATLEHAMCGKFRCEPHERKLGADLGLYSITFNNNLEYDREALQAYHDFRLDAESKGFRHFLEVFSPNAPGSNAPKDVASFVSNHIVRALAGVTSAGRPVFLKIPYYGPAAMEALVRYDSMIVVGILGGSAGTTFDAFQMLWDARKYGARVALYGRKINKAEHQLTFIRYLRALADGEIMPIEAVKSYHADLKRLNIRPHLPLEDDLGTMGTVDSYGGAGKTQVQRFGKKPAQNSTTAAREPFPDFTNMTQTEKVAWNLRRIRS